jgi:hypothetical protein
MKTRMIVVFGFVVGFGGLIANTGQRQSTVAQLNGPQSNEQTPNSLLARLSYHSTSVQGRERKATSFTEFFADLF